MMPTKHNKAFTEVELIFVLLFIGIVLLLFSGDDDDKEEQIKSLQTENIRLKSNNNQLNNTISKYNIKPIVDNDDYDGHRLYNEVFNKK